MTAEQLEELLNRTLFSDEDLRQLSSIAPSLARRVLAAEKLVEALDRIAMVDDDGWTSDGHERCTEEAFYALTTYREASK